MPQVPVYGGSQVRENAQAPNYLDARRFTGGAQSLQEAGRSLQNAGEVFDRAATREAQQQAYDVETKIRADYMLFEQDARKTRQGTNAKGLSNDVDEWWKKAAETYGKDLSPMARQLASRSLNQSRLQAQQSAGAFENQQLENALDQSWAASKIVAISDAAANPAPERIGAAVSDLKRKNAEQAARRGWSPEQLQGETLKDTTTLHTNVLDKLAESNPAAAKEYFKRYQGEINGTFHDNIEDKLAKAGRAEEALVLGSALAQKFSWTQTGDALKALDEMNAVPADVKIAARQDLLQRHSIAKADADQVNANSTKQLMSAVAAGATLAQLQKMPQWAGLQDGGAQIQDYLQRKSEALQRKAEHDEDRRQRQFDRAERRADRAESQAERAERRAERAQERVGMAAYFRYSDPEVLNGMSRPQVEALLPTLGAQLTDNLLKKKDAFTKSGDKVISANIDNEMFNAIAAEMKLDPYAKNKSEDEKAHLGQVKLRIETLIDRAQAKGPLGHEEKAKLMRTEMARTVTVDRNFFRDDPQVPVIALTAKDLAKIKITSAERAQIEAGLKAQGIAVNDKNVRDTYLRFHSSAAELLPSDGK